jgi:hypothetical protein
MYWGKTQIGIREARTQEERCGDGGENECDGGENECDGVESDGVGVLV